MSLDDVLRWLGTMVNESIYDGQRLAQPDEAANYRRADGVEKGLLLANVIASRKRDVQIDITIDKQDVVVSSEGKEYRFVSAKGFDRHILLGPDGGIEVEE
jgi:hypothetical protein